MGASSPLVRLTVRMSAPLSALPEPDEPMATVSVLASSTSSSTLDRFVRADEAPGPGGGDFRIIQRRSLARETLRREKVGRREEEGPEHRCANEQTKRAEDGRRGRGRRDEGCLGEQEREMGSGRTRAQASNGQRWTNERPTQKSSTLSNSLN